MKYKEIKSCRVCGNNDLIPIINLGNQSLQGRFPSADDPDPFSAPLELVKCNNCNNSDACGLVQLKHSVNPDELYKNDYGYRSGLNNTMKKHLASIADKIINHVKFNDNDIVLDIGSNDGTLLKSYNIKNINLIGIDPGGQQYSKYYPENIRLITDYFSGITFLKNTQGKKAKVITSISMFYDLESPLDFVKDIKECLADDGIWVLEQSYLPLMLKRNSFDTICHEHLEYYTLEQITWMLEHNDLQVIDVEFNDINGGSFRLYVAHKNAGYTRNTKIISDTLSEEQILRTNTPFVDFQKRVVENGKLLKEFLVAEKAKGKSIYIYGASTKGNTLLQYYGIGNDLISAAAERNEDKWGKRTPGTNIPIISEDEARSKNPDYFLVLPWHFKDEFIQRESKFLENGGHFIFPLPEFQIV